MQPDLDGYDYTLERQLKPEVRIDVQKVLKEKGIKPTSMIDISDGLASEVLHISTRSKLGCSVYEDKIPIDVTAVNTAKEFEIDPTTFALNGGEDYELLFTVKQGDYEKIKDIPDISIIGHMTEASEGVNLISRSGTQIPITAQGWDAFLKKQMMGDDHSK
jgi:thiamine-monophosphate kinase